MNYLLEQIRLFIPKTPQEAIDKQLILENFERFGENLLYRSCDKAHFTSSAIILNKDKDHMLMVHHNIYQTWTWVGGHADGDPNLFNVAIKEAKEETGLSNLIYYNQNFISLEALMVKQHFKNNQTVPEHWHYNVSYVFTASMSDKIKPKQDENSDVRWIKIDELNRYVSEPHMLEIYQKIIKRFIFEVN